MTVAEHIDSLAWDSQDWITIWQSEMAALAVDRECHEALVTGARAWKAIHDASTAGDASFPGYDGSARRAGPDAPPGAEAAGAASGNGHERSGDDGDGGEMAQLRRRIAELERAAASHGRD